MSAGHAAIHVVDVGSLGFLYKGDGSWAALWASWQNASPWSGSVWSPWRGGASRGVMARRRGRSGVLRGQGRPGRKRRQYLARAHKAAGRRSLERSRQWQRTLAGMRRPDREPGGSTEGHRGANW